MPSLPKSKLLVALAAVTALLALPTAAGATLTYVKNPMNPVVYAANDNGGGAFKVGSGTNPKVSPDGDVIAYSREGNGGKRGLVLGAAKAGGVPVVPVTESPPAGAGSFVAWQTAELRSLADALGAAR